MDCIVHQVAKTWTKRVTYISLQFINICKATTSRMEEGQRMFLLPE